VADHFVDFTRPHRSWFEAWTMFDSEDNLRLLVEKYAEAGITEFILYYPLNGEQVDVFENVSRDVIPELRAIYA